jgi:UDP-N-acetylmuramyl pentapeptide phosphotransferase/UDP-N-acetylglucosamine-1-phosphate transferase
VPNDRSSHHTPTPRIGGLAILAGIIAGQFWSPTFAWSQEGAIVIGALTLASLAILDDLYELPRFTRLLTQIIVATVVAQVSGLRLTDISLPFVGGINLGTVSTLVTVFWVVGLVNAYNFMDGINGIASLEACVAGLTLAILLDRGSNWAGAILALTVASAALGFLPANLRGAIFMGDVGSASLGFLLAFSVLQASATASFIPAMLPLFPFLFDAGVTVVKRIAKGERFFSTPHKSHFYQRLVTGGRSHGAVAALYTALAICCASVALSYSVLPEAYQAAALLSLLVIHVAVGAVAVGSYFQRARAPADITDR